MEKQLIIIICICVFSLVFIVLSTVLIVLKKIKTKRIKISQMEDENRITLDNEFLKISKLVTNNKFILSNNYIFNSKIFESGPILVNSYGLFVINEFDFEGKYVEGSFNNREWYITKEKSKYYTYNPLWKLNKNIQDLMPLLPKNLPIVGILVFNKINQFDINNIPQHLLHTSIDNFYETFSNLKKYLTPVLSTENVNKIIDLLNAKSS